MPPPPRYGVTDVYEYLALYRLSTKCDGGLCGVPAGKVDAWRGGEDDVEAMAREPYEEMGHRANCDEFELIGRYYGHNDMNGRPTLEYPTFRLEIPANFATRLERSAHDEHRWMTSDQLPKLKWVAGQAFVFAAAKAWPDDALIDPANNDGHFEWVEGSSLSADQFNANLGR